MADKPPSRGTVRDHKKLVEQLKQQKILAEQGAKEKERIREENERIKTKERELKEAEEERKRLEALERPRILAAKREKLIAERNARRVAQAESSEKILAEKAEELAQKNLLRDFKNQHYRSIVQEMCENRSAQSRSVEKKLEELRRVFVFLDKNNDGIISVQDYHSRLTSLGCKISLKASANQMKEIKEVFEELYGGHEPRTHWAWAMKMHQPSQSSGKDDLKFEDWSMQGPSKASSEPSFVQPERSWDNLGQPSEDNPDWLPHPSMSHMKHLQAWTETWEHRIICPDAIDCSTRRDIQHPPLLSPRKFLDVTPQNSKQETVEPVMLTESGIMTEKDWRAHLSLTPDSIDLGWIGIRDCFLKYSTEMVSQDPIKFFSIVEFLMADRQGKGTASLEDCMSLMQKRFGSPSDTQFVKLFGNSCDPQEQISLPEYLDKVRMFMAMREITKPSRGRTATAERERKMPPRALQGGGLAEIMKMPRTPAY